jgi:hypothetical protein
MIRGFPRKLFFQIRREITNMIFHALWSHQAMITQQTDRSGLKRLS